MSGICRKEPYKALVVCENSVIKHTGRVYNSVINTSNKAFNNIPMTA